MSRIHEALRKAEHERSGASAPADTREAQQRPGNTPVGQTTAPEAQTPSTASAGVSRAPQGRLTYEELMDRCPEHSWLPDQKTMLFFNGRPRVVGAEEFRTLRSRLYQIREKQPLRTLLITSALPGEGKTFTAANLAQVIVRQHERRALLIDADLRRPQLHISLGAPASPGLSDYLLGECDEFAVLQRGSMKNLFFLPRGKAVSNPSELIANGRFKMLLDRLAPVFDWLIIDSPAAMPVSDASVLANICDGLLLVIRAGSTPFDIAQKLRQDFGDRPLIGAVLNRMEPQEGYSSYYTYYAPVPRR